MAFDKNNTGPIGMSLNSVIDTEVSLDKNKYSNDNHHQADNMDAVTPSLESLQPDHEEPYQPLLPDTSADTRTSMVFINADSRGKKVLTGRANPTVNTVSSSLIAGAATSHQNTTQAEASSTEHAPAGKKAPQPFRRNRAVSLLSRGLAMASGPNESDSSGSDEAFSKDGGDASPEQPAFTRRDFVPDSYYAFDSSPSNGDGSPVFYTDSFPGLPADSLSAASRQATLEVGRTMTFKYVGDQTNGHENAMAALVLGISVAPLDAEDTVLTFDGIEYLIPNSDRWLHPYDNDDEKQIIPAERLAVLIRPSFGMSIWESGAQFTVELLGGRRLEDIRQTPTSQAMTTASALRLGISALRASIAGPITGAAPTENNDQNAKRYPPILRWQSEEHPIESTSDEGRSVASELSDGHNFGLRSREIDGRLDPRPVHSPMHFMRSPNTIRIGSEARSMHSVNTGGIGAASESEDANRKHKMNIEDLTKFGNTIRARLPFDLVTDDDFKELLDVIDMFLANESTEYAVELSVIIQSRFDKVLGDILRERVDPHHPLMDRSRTLQQAWAKRFGLQFIQIDELRLQSFLFHSLGGLVLKVDSKTRVAMWKFHRAATPIADAGLEPGQWFLNMPSLYKDELVKPSKHMFTTGKSDTLVLPLLTGVEVHGPDPGTYQYSRSDPEASWGPLARAALGKKVQVLRGYGLESEYAPKAGIRYDGEYELLCLRELSLGQTTEVPELRIVLQRLPRQIWVDALCSIPDPGQMDNWFLYRKYIRQMTTGPSSVAAERYSSEYDLNDVAYMEWSFDDVFD